MKSNIKKILSEYFFIILVIIVLIYILGYVITGVIFLVDMVSLENEENINEHIEFTDEQGEEYCLYVHGGGFPDYDVILYFRHMDGTDLTTLEISWDKEKKGLDYISDIQKEYHFEKTHIYQFPWGIVYSLDDRVTFASVGEKDYYLMLENSKEFEQVYNLLK